MEYIVHKIYRNGVVLPLPIREKLRLKDGDFIKITSENGKIILEKIQLVKGE